MNMKVQKEVNNDVKELSDYENLRKAMEGKTLTKQTDFLQSGK